jgi:proline iminopeptidase
MHANIRGTSIYFDIDGARDVLGANGFTERPTVFLLHGGPGGDHSGFKKRLAPLADTVQLVYIDHRGSGRSAPADPETYTLDHNIEDVDALRDYLGLDQISVFGASYGGMVAQGYAIRYPARVSSLVLAVTAPSHRFIDDARQFIVEHGNAEQQRVCEWLWNGSFEDDEQLTEYYRAMGPLYSRTFDPAQFDAQQAEARRNFVQLNMGFGGFLRTFDFTEDLATIACPTLVLAGAHDWICAPHHSQTIAERIPRAHLKIFPHSGHGITNDEPEAFLSIMRGFYTHSE